MAKLSRLYPASGLLLLGALAVSWPLVHAGCGAGESPPEESAPVPAVEPPAPVVKEKPAAAPPAPAPAPAKPRLWAKTRFVWIKPEPGGQGWIGFLWIGGSVELRDEKPVAGAGCSTKWYPIEPRGWVCADGEKATLDENDPVLVAVKKYAPKLDTPWPHQYGESRGAQKYSSLPTPEQQRRREWDLAEHLKGLKEQAPAPDNGIAFENLPPTIHEARKRLLPLSTVAWSAETFAHDRSWLLTADFTWVPRDRVEPYAKVTFRGVHLGKDSKLPLAFFRTEAQPKWIRDGEGKLTPSKHTWPRLAHVELTGERIEQDGKVFLETRDSGHWVEKTKHTVVPEPQEKTPWGAPVGGADTKEGPDGRRTWLEASVWQGWLIAYEGTKPVFVTLIAPGRGGTPTPGKPAIDTAATPTGTFKITGKFATATMEAPGEFIHSDVPWAQNFSGPHALHGAYWHDDWGNRMSGGCVNVSPTDGKWLYEFTEPPAPEGWHGVRWRPHAEPATTFVVHD